MPRDGDGDSSIQSPAGDASRLNIGHAASPDLPLDSARPRRIRSCHESILKSPNDTDRSYRGLELDNGLRVIIVSDPGATTSAACMNVGVGYAADPKSVQGLAHFLEHMLFLGTQKYPNESEYTRFVTTHGGETNAFTAVENTIYYFAVSSNLLSEALDRFGSFFVSPLFNEDATQRELNAIDSEFQKSRMNDAFRLKTLLYSLVDPEHPLRQFGAGNLKSLAEEPTENGIDVKRCMEEFFHKWYSSKIMTLCVVGKESLDELQEMVAQSFSDIVESPSTKRMQFSNPFVKSLVGSEIHIVPITDTREMNVYFNIPHMSPKYRSAPDRYVESLIEHEGPGSLLVELQKRNWAVKVSANTSFGCKGFDLLVISVVLRQAGLDNVYGILELIFHYIEMLRKVGPKEWYFDELSRMAEIQFKYKSKEREQDLVCDVAELMHLNMPIEHVLKYGSSFDLFDGTLIEDVLEHLKGDNMFITVHSKLYERDRGLKEEKWFGTQYLHRKIPENLIERFNNLGLLNCFHLPSRNEFIPTNLSLIPCDQDSELPKVPKLIQDSPIVKLWYKQDDYFFVPKASISILIRMPATTYHPLSQLMSGMLLNLFGLSVQELMYEASFGGIVCGVDTPYIGIELSLKGFSEKLIRLTLLMMTVLSKFDPDDEILFLDARDRLKRSYENSLLVESYLLGMHLLDNTLLSPTWSTEELLRYIDLCTLDRLKQFLPQALSSLHFEILVHGNIAMNDALNMCRDIETMFTSARGTQPLLPAEMYWRRRSVQLPDRSFFSYSCTSRVQSTYALVTYFQVGARTDVRSSAIIDLYCQIISDDFFEELRTKKQLGYVVFLSPKKMCGSEGVELVVNSPEPIRVCDEAFEEFIDSVDDRLSALSEEDFDNFKSGLVNSLLEKPKKLSTESYRYWSAISTGDYNFYWAEETAEKLRSLTIGDVLNFHRTFIRADGEKRKKLSIHVLPPRCQRDSVTKSSIGDPVRRKRRTNVMLMAREESEDDDLSDSRPAVFVKDIAEFKAHLPLFPLVKPVIPITVAKSNL